MIMKRRSGATLVEVLVAIFIMGIGMLCLLTLFPIGVLSMSRAIQQDRATQSEVSASGIAAMAQIRQDANVTEAMEGRDNSVAVGQPGNIILPPLPATNRSYPVFVDPIGFQTAAGTFGWKQVAGVPFLPRVMPSFITSAGPIAQQKKASYLFYTLLDDIVFDNVDVAGMGTPKFLLANTFERDTAYSWAYLVQRPRISDAAAVELSVVVYVRRPLSLTGAVSLPET
jgi:hypothetical protein